MYQSPPFSITQRMLDLVFRIGERVSRMMIRFDLIVDFSVDDREQVFDAVREEVAERYPGYSISAILDIDV